MENRGYSIRTKHLVSLLIVSLFSGAVTLGFYKLFLEKSGFSNNRVVTTAPDYSMRSAGYNGTVGDFTEAAEKTIHNVVHVKNVSQRTLSNPILEFFYGYEGEKRQEQVGTGSGVIISEDGYIVTNNHVVKGATDLEITLNDNTSYKAKLIGVDDKMDIALLKIEPTVKLPYCVFANSDNIKVGEWVLAVGNPYNLNSTVTAGIVSAKARNFGLRSIQSFIQTDAAVNPGNSGGALVNVNGELIGINTMISSNTGSYVGYSFAVPSNLVKKVVEDIMEFGNVQRGSLGIEGVELNAEVAKSLNVKNTQGFYVKNVKKNSSAQKSGIQSGDIIVKIDQQKISTFADISGYINARRPNETVQVTVKRGEDLKTYPVVIELNKFDSLEIKGLELENIDDADKKKFKITFGVKIKSINNENLTLYSNELIGAIIYKIGGYPAKDVETVTKMSDAISKSNVLIEGYNVNGEKFRIIL